MARFFALPVLGTMLALVGVRWMAAGEPAEQPLEIVVSLPVQETEQPFPEPAPAPQEKAAEPTPPPPVPKPEPVIIILEPIPAPTPVAPAPVAPAPVTVTQTTVVNNNYYPVVYPVAEPEPVREVVETPVLVVMCAAHRRSGCCLPSPKRPVRRQQDAFFKSIPFLPPTPRGPRYNP